MLISGTSPDPDVSKLKNRYVGRWQRAQDSTTGLILMGARPYDLPLGGPFDGGLGGWGLRGVGASGDHLRCE